MNDSKPSVSSPITTGPLHPPVKTIEDVIVFKLGRFTAINERMGQRWSETMFDLSLNEWRMLGLIEAHQPVRAGDLAELMLMDKSQLSRLIKSLTAKTHITSLPDKEDARAITLSITVEGQKLFEDIIAQVMHRNEVVLGALSTEEVIQFNGLLDRLLHHNMGLLKDRRRSEG